ncbi:ankyrin repeat-containing domain protein [Mycena polygramma]|nr:ankyrin repeat-containing domain protein [Mycena polygramma]
MRDKQRETHALRHENSGSWFLKSTEFAVWKEQPGCLWLRGNCEPSCFWPTDNCLTIVNSHLATPNYGIAYFYFDFRDEKKQLLETMLRSIIMQLSEQSPIPYSVLDLHFQSCQGGKFPTHNNLLVMLDTILSQFSGTYIILDALDECSEHDELVKFISTLCGWCKPVHLLVASQPRTIFLDSTALKGASVVALESKKTKADILQFVNSKLELDSKLKHIKKVKDAAPKIVNKSNGMFRMAACLLQELARKKIVTDIDKILATLPNDLFGIYTRFLQPIDEDDFVYVTTLLRWVAFSAEPITQLELEDALAIDFFKPDQCMFEPENKGRVEALWESLEGLVIVGPDTSTSYYRPKKMPGVVTLAHSSVNDYIMSKKFLEEYKHDLGEAPSHTFLAQSCVTYLLHFENHPLNQNTLLQYPLARYAAEFWYHHLLRCHDRGVLQHSIMHLLEQGSQQYVALNCLYNIESPARKPNWSWHTLSPLYLCSWVGYIEGVSFLLEHGADVNAAGGYFGSALQAAAARGNVDTVRLLLEHGTDVNAAGGTYGSALQAAVVNGNVDIVHVLLDRGANVNTVGREYGSALQGAASNGHKDIVRILLEHGTDVNAVDRDGDSALQDAAWRGHVDIVRILLEKGADLNAVGRTFGSALQAAVQCGHADVARILLEHGADANAAGGEDGSALQAAARTGRMDTVRLLLDHGADVNALGGIYGSALQGVASKGRMDIVRLLLEHGADVNAVDRDGDSALQDAAWRGHVDIVRILLEYGADVNAAGGEYGSALAAASAEGHEEIAQLLCEHGALDAESGKDSE